MLLQSLPLVLDLDTGAVYLRTEAEALEFVGHIEDDGASPCEYRDDWSCLLDRWRDALGGGHEWEAQWSDYERLSIPRMN